MFCTTFTKKKKTQKKKTKTKQNKTNIKKKKEPEIIKKLYFLLNLDAYGYNVTHLQILHINTT